MTQEVAMQAAQQEADTHEPGPGHEHDIEVTVSFPLAGKGPFRVEVPPDTTAGAVLAQAMEHFGVVDDSTERYFLTHDGDPIDPSKTVGAIVGKSDSVKFTLAKELIQG
jgi:TUG ubiquitin-like domain